MRKDVVENESAQELGNLINGSWIHGPARREIRDKYSGALLAIAHEADREMTWDAVTAAREHSAGPVLTAQERYRILATVAERLRQERDALATEVAQESGFSLKDCIKDADRAVQTMLTSAEEAKRIDGEMVPIHAAPGFENRMAFTLRKPVGVVCAITPFNSPLNTVAHKIGPALAAGNATILKPSVYTPIAAVRLCEILAEAGTPNGMMNLVLGGADPVGDALVDDARVDFYTFTGSTAVGMKISSKLGMRRATMECGNVSNTIICKDANIRAAVTESAHAAFRKSGQVCTSVQRLYVHSDVMDQVAHDLKQAAEQLSVGNPMDPATDIGPMISSDAAMRAQSWVDEAVDEGAELLTGGLSEGSLFPPTILVNVASKSKVACEEIFAPVVSLVPFRDLDQVYDVINESPYGLQAGIYTESMNIALQAMRSIRVGGLVVNGTSSTRADLMPYGGIGHSGYGKEGPRYAIRDMTNEQIVIIGATA